MELTRDVAAKVLEIVDAGLSSGMGEPVAGQMCVEAAVCFALGLPHGDNPPCVGSAVRAFKIKLNDCGWSSDAARAKGLRRVAIAQLGSVDIDQREFVKIVAEQTIRQILPIALRAAARNTGDATRKSALEEAAKRCEEEGTRESAIDAKKTATAATAAAYATAATAATAATYAAAYAATAYATADYAYAATAYAATAYATAAAYATTAAAAAAAAEKSKTRDSVLSIAAEIAVQALVKLKCVGTQWLDLCD